MSMARADTHPLTWRLDPATAGLDLSYEAKEGYAALRKASRR
jgi:hypothetical protein